MSVEIRDDPGQAMFAVARAESHSTGELDVEYEGSAWWTRYRVVAPGNPHHPADAGRVEYRASHGDGRWYLLQADRPLAGEIAPHGARPKAAAVIERWIAGLTPA